MTEKVVLPGMYDGVEVVSMCGGMCGGLCRSGCIVLRPNHARVSAADGSWVVSVFMVKQERAWLDCVLYYYMFWSLNHDNAYC